MRSSTSEDVHRVSATLRSDITQRDDVTRVYPTLAKGEPQPSTHQAGVTEATGTQRNEATQRFPPPRSDARENMVTPRNAVTKGSLLTSEDTPQRNYITPTQPNTSRHRPTPQVNEALQRSSPAQRIVPHRNNELLLATTSNHRDVSPINSNDISREAVTPTRPLGSPPAAQRMAGDEPRMPYRNRLQSNLVPTGRRPGTRNYQYGKISDDTVYI